MQDDFLGNPPSVAKSFILRSYTGHPETRFTLQDGTVESYNINGVLNRQWLEDNGFYNIAYGEWTKTIITIDIGNTVISIGDFAFESCNTISSLIISNSVTNIGDYAFSSCTNLRSITIPFNVTGIGLEAFQNCSNVYEMHFISKDTTTIRNMIVNDYILGQQMPANQTIRIYCSDGSLDVSYVNDEFHIVVNSSGCLLKGTHVTLADGTEKLVEDITYDDELLVWDFDNGRLATAKPAWIKKPEQVDYYFINTYASGNKLLTTGQSETGWGHRTFDISKNKFVYTTESVSDTIYTLDGPDMHMSCTRVDEPCEYYNIITEGHFNLFANRILASCSLNNLYPISEMKFEKDNRELRKLSDYNVPEKMFNALRLAENNRNIEKLNEYVGKLIELAID